MPPGEPPALGAGGIPVPCVVGDDEGAAVVLIVTRTEEYVMKMLELWAVDACRDDAGVDTEEIGEASEIRRVVILDACDGSDDVTWTVESASVFDGDGISKEVESEPTEDSGEAMTLATPVVGPGKILEIAPDGTGMEIELDTTDGETGMMAVPDGGVRELRAR